MTLEGCNTIVFRNYKLSGILSKLRQNMKLKHAHLDVERSFKTALLYYNTIIALLIKMSKGNLLIKRYQMLPMQSSMISCLMEL